MKDKLVQKIANACYEKERGKASVELSNRELKLILSALMRINPKLIFEYSKILGSYYCPHCYSIVDVEYQKNCRCCGQKLKWYGYRKYCVSLDYIKADKKRKKYSDVMLEYQALQKQNL